MLGDQAVADWHATPDHFFKSYPDVVSKLKMIYYANHVVKYYDLDFLKIYSSPLLLDVGKTILNKYRSHLKLQDAPYPTNYRLYSAHDTTITPVLLILGLIKRDCLITQA